MNVKSGKIEPQRYESNNRRPLTPLLSFGQLNPFEATSGGSTSSPLYLSPPAPGDVSSPPPQREGDGYFGPNTHQRTKGKPVVSSAKVLAQGPRVLSFETLPHRRTASGRTQPDSNDDVDEHQAHNHGSIAVRTLRRYSESSVNAENLRPPPLLESISSTLKMLFASKDTGAFEVLPNEDVEGTTDETSWKKSKNRISHAAMDRRRAKAKQHTNPTASLNIPATITLRKASASYQSEPKTGTNKEAATAEIVHENGLAFRTAVTAIAFQSRPLDSTRMFSSVEHEARRMKFLKYASDESGAARQRAMSMTELGGTSEVPRHSLLAETGLTLQEAHRDPGKFTTSPNSRRHSVSAAGILRRLSTIRAGLRGSVHEIIWQEDQTPSGASSQTSVSPTRKESLPGITNHGTERRPFNGGFGGTELIFGAAALSGHGSSSKEKQSVFHDTMLHLRQSYGNIFDWSWNEHPPGITNSNPHPTDPPNTAEPNSNSDSKERRPSISKTSRIHSFPPLSPRKHTSEWRKAPLPDLNDPAVGRAPHELAKLKYPDGFGSLMDQGLDMYSSISTAVNASMASDVDAGLVKKTTDAYSKIPHAGSGIMMSVGNGAKGPKRSKSVSYAPLPVARMGAEGKAGSSIGVSSHKRVAR